MIFEGGFGVFVFSKTFSFGIIVMGDGVAFPILVALDAKVVACMAR